ncbi:Arrestin-N domain-containing protein [Mycena sanguinolenta]|uniref:Arrestin-N domain-containing protein n=1 Tax=Mycena sanguinolenta TaxID=230812 RepID=A0A8H7D357_9AGAR|nr:Arrestin-N domain-containing protein [Mycena sanguinolenta]
MLRQSPTLSKVFAVVPAATAEELGVKESLQQSWTGPWRDITQEKKLRRGMWGDYSKACATLSIPDLPSYPICTPIPIVIQILTETKSVPRSDQAENKGKSLFPAPPTHSSQLKQVLCRVTNIKVQNKVARQRDTFDLPVTRGLDNTEIARVESLCEIEAVVDEPEWIPKEKDRGVWKRSVRFALELQFPLPPTHSTEILDWQYELSVVIPFPGMGNDLKISSPIQLCASSSRESTSLPPQIHFSPCASLLSEWISAEDQAVRISRVETTTGATALLARLVLWATRLATPYLNILASQAS